MLIFIFVLVGIAGVVWYIARDQARIDSEQTNLPIECDVITATAVETTPPKSSPSVKQIDEVLSSVPVIKGFVQDGTNSDEIAQVAPEVVAAKSFAESQQVVLTKDQEVPNAESIDTPKPAKKKTRYYHKKK